MHFCIEIGLQRQFFLNFLGSDDLLLDGFILFKLYFSNIDQNINLYTAVSFYDGFIGKSLNKIKLIHSIKYQIQQLFIIIFIQRVYLTSFKICGIMILLEIRKRSNPSI